MSITRLASNEIFSPSNKVHREVGRAKDLSAPLYSSTDLLNQTQAQHDVPYLCSLLDNYSVDGDVTEPIMSKVKVKVAFWSFFNTEAIWPIVFLLPASSRIHLQRRHASYRCARPLPAKVGTITKFC